MRKLIFVLALSSVSVGFAGTASAKSLRAEDCRPLTPENAQSCCAAGMRNLLRPQDAALCRSQAIQGIQSVASPATGLGTPPGTPNPPGGTNNPPGSPGPSDQGMNNGFGNGVQSPPGNSGPNNNADNANPSRSDPGKSAH